MNRPKLNSSAPEDGLPKWGPAVRELLRKLRAGRRSFEQIAVDLKVSRSTIDQWYIMRRVPRYATVRYMEKLYGVQIIPNEPVQEGFIHE